MRRWLLAMLLVCGCGERSSLDPLDPESFRQFAGTMTVEAGGQTNVYEYHRNGSKIRIVPQTSAGSSTDQRVAVLVDQEAGTATSISWGRRQYFVQPLSTAAASLQWPLSRRGERPQVASRKSLETADLDGHTCAVESVVMRSDTGSTYGIKVWSANDLRGFPLRIEASSPSPVTVTFRGVTLDPVQDPAMFEVPEGFTNAARGG